ncbi:RHS repeat-associated protein [Cereibacter ovatus]|uniref:RHS repeat-associated protein n=1 Tax=Cereibacter ovatus TaxID=439529 RepID=A0A285CIM4_9RHOB|nr:SpvB/TcaC N-terminal domain-containing protein [Cereibacter ovatus]SNX67457.1 RHS repeat-associated protein [Cereibacter ovatus]
MTDVKGSSGQNWADLDTYAGFSALTAEKPSDLGAIEIPDLKLPAGGGAIRGIDEKFSVNAANGTASITIALPLTPGRDGFGPKLALGYSSGAGDGPFGLGWSLSLPAIQRKTDKGLPRYLDPPDEDVFTIAGSEDLVPELVEAAPGDWQRAEAVVGALRVWRYRPRVAGDFSRIENIDDPARGVWWKVTDRADTVTIFGRDPAARLADPADPRRIFRWLPEFSHDNRGNWIAYGYRAEDGAGMPDTSAEANRRSGRARFTDTHLKRVRYGNHVPWFPDPAAPYDPAAPADPACHYELVFDYGEHDAAAPTPLATPGQDWLWRPDAFSSYRAGFEVRTARLCRRILMFHHFPGEALGADALVRSLDLHYAPVSVNGVGQAAASLLVAAEQAGHVRRADGSYSRKTIPPLGFHYQPIGWDMHPREIAPEDLVDAPSGLTAPYRLVDLYGEGIAGILCEAGNSWIYKHNRGPDPLTGAPRFERGQTLGARPNVAGLAQAAVTLEDLDASGQKQIVVNAPQRGGYFQLDAVQQWQPFRAFPMAPNLDFRDPLLRRIDLTGDGRLSILLAEDEALVWHVSRGKDGFGPAERVLRAFDEENGPAVIFAEAEQSVFLADMSGDGLSDIVRIRNGDVSYWPNLGHGRFGARVAMSAPPLFDLPDRFDPARLRLADLTGTGPADLIYLGVEGSRVWLNQAGNGWGDPVAIPGLPPIDSVHSIDIADILGRGTPCFVWSCAMPDAALRFIDPMGGAKPHLLTRYTNNMGKETRIDYRSSSVDYLRDRAAGQDWATRLPFPVQVVARHQISEAISGARVTSLFSYHHGYWDAEEREFRGFGRVDRTDTEDFTRWAEGQPGGPLTVGQDQFQAPVLTRTWYHVGAWDDAGRLVSRFAAEFWPAAHDRAFPAEALGQIEPALPEGRLVASTRIADPAALARLSPAERREAARACKSLVLRQEIFALDAPAVGGSAEDLRRQMLPFSVDTHSCHVQLLQPRGPNRHAVFVVVEDEAISLHYERNPVDPRIDHAINLEIDDLGNVLEAAQISYGRDPVAAAVAADAISASVSDFSGFDDPAALDLAFSGAIDRAEASQTRTWITVARTRFSNDIDTPAHWRTRLPVEVERFEITGLFPAAHLFTQDELRGVLGDARSALIAYDAAPAGGVERRRIEHSVSLYYDAGLQAALPWGQIAAHGLVCQSLTKALTPALLTALFGPRLPAGPATEARMQAAGYLHHDGDADWWVPSGHLRYLDPGEGLAEARARFLRPRGHVDPFGAETRVAYHKDYFLLLGSVTDAAGNRVLAEAFDFRAMAPTRLRDPNDNISGIVFDELALVTAQAFLGKDLDGDGLAELEPADDLAGHGADSGADAALVADFLAATDSQVMEPIARQLLRQATMRFVYDLHAFRLNGRPAVAAKIVRTRHHADDPAAPLHLSFDYTDGSGALAMTKTQAEPGPAQTAALNPDGSVTVLAIDTAAQVPPRLRWVGTGRTVLNNKAKPIREYQPYFAVSPAYESLPELVATGVSATLTYDPLGRLLRTDLPDGTHLATRFDPWSVTRFDPGDRVAASRWHDDRIARRIDAQLLAQGRDPLREAEAAAAALSYADTPATVLLDSLARPVLALDHAGFDAGGGAVLFATTILRDVEGNVHEVLDARGNRPVAWGHDMIGRRLVQQNMDSGRRWVLQTVTGNPLVKWDERGHELRFGYDAMQRPVSQHVLGGDGPVPLDHVVMRADYGEGLPDDRRHGLRGRMARRWDTGGLEEWRRFDGKGNLIESTRRFARDYRATVNWSGDLFAPLEAETHVTRHDHDALGRLVRITAADGSVTERFYSEANLLTRVVVTPAGGVPETVVRATRHDARGQRLAIELGNGTRTDYRYDPLTFRLIGITSTTSAGVRVQDLAYTHDCVGNLTHQEDRAQPVVYFDNARVVALSRYGYDALYRLIRAEGREHAGQTANGFGALDNWDDGAQTLLHAPGDAMAWRGYVQRYRHDPVGNLLSLAHTATGGSYTRNHVYEAATNRLIRTEIGADVYPCDHHPAHGFIRAMPHLPLMVYSHRDELRASARQVVAAGTPETTWYVHDHDGHRIRKVTDNAAAGAAVPTRKAERLYLGGIEIFRSHSGATAGLERRSLMVMDDLARVAMIDLRNGVDDGTPARVTRFQIASHLGSVGLELDSAERLLGYEEFHPFGTTAYRATGTTLPVAERRHRYSGMERDEESGLSCHAARYYAPWLGRFLKPDPAGLADGVNDYQYASGNPVRISDPAGLGGWDRFWGGVKMVGGALETVAGGALVAAGVASSEIGVGIPLAAAGVFVTAHGADVTVSGARTMWNGAPVDTLTSQGLQEVGMSRTAANLTDAGISVVGSLGSSAIVQSGRVLTVAEGAAVAGDDAVQVIRGSEQAAAAVATRTGNNLVHLSTAENTAAMVSTQTLGRGGTIYAGPSGLATASDAQVLLRTGLTGSQTPNVLLIPERAAGAFQTPTVIGPMTAWQRMSGTVHSVGAGEINLATGLFTRTGAATNQIVIQGIDVTMVAGVRATPELMLSVGRPAAGSPEALSSGPSMEPPILIVPFPWEPTAPTGPTVDEPLEMPDETPMASYSEDPAAQVCTADGYYDTIEEVCYAY